MTTAVVGASAASFSVAVMPSIPGMLMSIRTTSGLSAAAICTASGPAAAAPTTSTSLSKPSSFDRWSRVSGMSSTIRTLMRSVIGARLSLSGWTTGRGGRLLLLQRGRDRDLDDLRRQDAVLVHEGLQDHAGDVDSLSGVRQRAQDGVERAGRAGVQQDLRLFRGDGEDEQLVGARDARLLGGGRRGGLALGRCRGRSVEDADDLDVLEQERELDAQRVDAR